MVNGYAIRQELDALAAARAGDTRRDFWIAGAMFALSWVLSSSGSVAPTMGLWISRGNDWTELPKLPPPPETQPKETQ